MKQIHKEDWLVPRHALELWTKLSGWNCVNLNRLRYFLQFLSPWSGWECKYLTTLAVQLPIYLKTLPSMQVIPTAASKLHVKIFTTT